MSLRTFDYYIHGQQFGVSGSPTHSIGLLPVCLLATSEHPVAMFENVGTDLCEPFQVKASNRQQKPMKVHVAVFVCIATKAVYLELWMNLTKYSFLAAFEKFLS